MSSKIEVSRELLQHILDGGYCKPAAMDELAAILAAPVVEHQPVAEVQHGPFDDVGAPQWVRVATLGDFDLENFPNGTKFYIAPPELAELQATIAQLTAENERLKGGQGEPVAYQRKWDADGVKPYKERNENGRMAWAKKFIFVPISKMRIFEDDVALFASQPAPVSASKPVVWRIPVNGDWFYGTKEQCEREYAEYTADFTADDFDEDGPAKPEPLAGLDKVKELNQ